MFNNKSYIEKSPIEITLLARLSLKFLLLCAIRYLTTSTFFFFLNFVLLSEKKGSQKNYITVDVKMITYSYVLLLLWTWLEITFICCKNAFVQMFWNITVLRHTQKLYFNVSDFHATHCDDVSTSSDHLLLWYWKNSLFRKWG